MNESRDFNNFEIMVINDLLKLFAQHLDSHGFKPYRIGVEFGSDFNGIGFNYFYTEDVWQSDFNFSDERMFYYMNKSLQSIQLALKFVEAHKELFKKWVEDLNKKGELKK